MKKQVFAVLLCLCLVISLSTSGAFAADDGVLGMDESAMATIDDSIRLGDQVLEGTGGEPAYALTDANGCVILEGADESNYNAKWDGVHLTLKDSYILGVEGYGTYGEGDAVSASVDVMLTLVGDNRLVGEGEESGGIAIYGGGDLSITGDGSLTVAGDHSGIYIDSGTLTIQRGTIVANGGIGVFGFDIVIAGGSVYASGDGYQGIYADSDMSVTGGVITAKGSTGIMLSEGSSLTISGSAIVTAVGETSGITVQNDEMNFTGGTITAIGLSNYGLKASQSIINIGGGNITVSGAKEGVYADSGLFVIAQDAGGIAVAAGEDGLSSAAIEGSPFGAKTEISDLLEDCKFVTLAG